jgi:hypothetical protein
MSRVNRVEDLDLLGYYDFHWKRGGHWAHLSKAWRVAKAGLSHFFSRYFARGRRSVAKSRAPAGWAGSAPFFRATTVSV